MIIQKKNFLKLIGLAILLTAFIVPQNVEAQRKKKRKKDEVVAPVKPAPKKPKEKKIGDLVKSSKEIDGLFKIYQDTITGSLQMVISNDQLDQEYIYFSQIANGVTDAGTFRGRYKGSKVFKIKKYFNKIEFVTQNTSFYFDPDNAISKSQKANTSEGNMASLKIEAFDKEKGLYLIKADDLFLKETFAQIKPARSPGQKPTAFTLGNLDNNKTKINAINNYPENTNLSIEYVYSKSSTLNGGSEAVSDGRNVSIKVFHSLMVMPENEYEIRLDDPRVGYFTTQVTDQTATGSTPYRDLVHRWNLVKKDPNAAISEPVEPITWWIENTTPVEWRETIKEGVLEWNKAFEKAGFKNAMVVNIQPDDADWDAGDIRYNVLRFTSSPQVLFGGYGPSFVNPRTGEILGADIMLEYANIKGLILADKLYDISNDVDNEFEEISNANDPLYCSLGHLMSENLSFANTALTVADASDLELKRIKKEWWKATAMHEIGHTLGLSHNMKASQLYSPEELDDKDFIKGKALTASVMDYPAVHLTNDRTKQGQYFDMGLGPYDDWAIQFGYTPFKSKKELNDLLDQSTKPEHIFGNDADDMRSPGKAIDPRVMIGDLSNDQIGYSIDRIELVNSMMKDIKTKFSKKGESYQELLRAYSSLSRQRASAANIVSRFIGGVYVDRAMAGQEGGTQPFTPVSYEDQKRAMNTLHKYVFAPDAFNTPSELFNYLATQRRGFNFRSKTEDPKIHTQVLNSQKRVLAHILHPNTLQRISDSELYGNKYSLSAFMNDLNKAIFNADIYGNVNSFRQNLQVAYTDQLIGMLTGKSKSSYSNMARSMALYNLKKIRTMSAPSGNVASKAHKQHLRTLIDNAVEEIK